MTPYWFKPDHQPKPDEPVEFEIRPLDLRAAYEAQSTMHDNGALSLEVVRSIFLRHVTAWRGIAEPCSQNARQRILGIDGAIFGFELRDWLIWTAHIARHAYLQSIFTDEEKKTS